MPINGSFPVTINAPIDKVWPWISELERHPDWSPKKFRIELVSGDPNSVGSIYRSVGWIPGENDHGNSVTVTEVVPMSRFALVGEDNLGQFSNTYELSSSGAGTEIVYRLVFPELKVPMKFLAPIAFHTVGSADIRKRMQLLKTKVEAAG